MASRYELHCDCGSVRIVLSGEPRVRAFCHCRNCRDLHNVAVNALTAWTDASLAVVRGQDLLSAYQYPGKEMVRYWCRECGATVYNTNHFGLKVVSQGLIRKHFDGMLPRELVPTKHLFYRSRVTDFIDDLPKFLDGSDGPLYDGTTPRIY